MRSIILASSAALVLVFLVGLVVSARSSAPAEVDDHALAQALASHKGERAPRTADAPAAPQVAAPADREPIVPRPITPPAHLGPRASAPVAPRLATAEAPAGETATVDTQMDEANRLYDKGNYEAAQAAALEILEGDASNVRMIRIVVSTACIMADEDKARSYYDKLPARDQRQIARRCQRYGIEL